MNLNAYHILTVLLLATTSLCHAQNLVRNPGFESYKDPPGGGALLLEDFVYDWASYYNTPDYFNTHFMGESGMLSYCGTLPHDGKGIVGAYVLGFFPSSGYNREYLQGQLTEPLKANTTYYAEMYVRPMLNAPSINFAVDKIGMAFTDKHYDYNASFGGLIQEIPEVENKSGIIRNMEAWTKISGCFVASGGETKILIGNFRKDMETDTMQLPGAFGEEIYHNGMSYYLFDDILVKEVTAAFISPNDTLVCRDSTVTLSAFPDDGSSYQWNNGATTPSIQTNKAGDFTVSFTTKEGCPQQASATISTRYCGPVCPELFVPTAFSPNQDGLNDYFQPSNSVDMTALEMSVYNRFGQRVFYGSGLNARWDGQSDGKDCDVATYFFYSRYQDCHGVAHTKKGDVVLIR